VPDFFGGALPVADGAAPFAFAWEGVDGPAPGPTPPMLLRSDALRFMRGVMLGGRARTEGGLLGGLERSSSSPSVVRAEDDARFDSEGRVPGAVPGRGAGSGTSTVGIPRKEEGGAVELVLTASLGRAGVGPVIPAELGGRATDEEREGVLLTLDMPIDEELRPRYELGALITAGAGKAAPAPPWLRRSAADLFKRGTIAGGLVDATENDWERL